MMSSTNPKTAIDPLLSFGLNFDSHDLMSNRNGRITSRQVRLLRDKRDKQSPSQSILRRIMGGMFFMIYGVTPQRHQWNLVGADITATITHDLQGQVRLPELDPHQLKGSPRSIYQISVDNKRCKVDRRALRSFQHQASYTVYYAPHSKYALSAEAV